MAQRTHLPPATRGARGPCLPGPVLAWVCLGLPGLPGPASDCLGLPALACDCLCLPGLPGSASDRLCLPGLPGSASDCPCLPGLPGSASDCLGLPVLACDWLSSARLGLALAAWLVRVFGASGDDKPIPNAEKGFVFRANLRYEPPMPRTACAAVYLFSSCVASAKYCVEAW